MAFTHSVCILNNNSIQINYATTTTTTTTTIIIIIIIIKNYQHHQRKIANILAYISAIANLCLLCLPRPSMRRKATMFCDSFFLHHLYISFKYLRPLSGNSYGVLQYTFSDNQIFYRGELELNSLVT